MMEALYFLLKKEYYQTLWYQMPCIHMCNMAEGVTTEKNGSITTEKDYQVQLRTIRATSQKDRDWLKGNPFS